MDALKRWRQPAAFVVLGALVAQLVISVVGVVVLARPEVFGSFLLAAASVAFLGRDASGLVVLALLVAACAVREPTSRARFLTAAAVVVSALLVLLTLASAIVGLVVGRGRPVVDVLTVMASLVPATVITVGLGMLWRHQARTAAVAGSVPADREVTGSSAMPSVEVARTAPVWAPDEASGAVWHTAGAAAAGGAASGWGSPDAPAGWNPVPGPPSPSAGNWTPPPSAVDWSPAQTSPSPEGEPPPGWAPPSGSRPPER